MDLEHISPLLNSALVVDICEMSTSFEGPRNIEANARCNSDIFHAGRNFNRLQVPVASKSAPAYMSHAAGN